MEFLVQLIGILIQQQGGNFTECSVSKFTCKPERRERERERDNSIHARNVLPSPGVGSNCVQQSSV
ncbi:unnamed protein product, partial [Musa acuminata subsp. burmannicoides]